MELTGVSVARGVAANVTAPLTTSAGEEEEEEETKQTGEETTARQVTKAADLKAKMHS